MQVLILAGGLGTRLRSIITDIPKPMADINGRPFLYFLIKKLSKSGVKKIVLAVGYRADVIEKYFSDGADFGIEIVYSREKEPLGTSGAIKNAQKYFTEDKFMVLNGDTYFDIDYTNAYKFQEKQSCMATIVVRKLSGVSRYGSVILNKNGYILAFDEKSNNSKSNLVNGGIYILNKEILSYIPEDKQCSFENETMPYLLKANKRIGGVIDDGYFIDIGVPEDYFKFVCDERDKML